MRKQESTNTENFDSINKSCDAAYALSIISGRWKLCIIGKLSIGPARYSELRDALKTVSDRVLASQLKQMEIDGLIIRKIFAEIPVRVEYQLTEKANALNQILRDLSGWGSTYK